MEHYTIALENPLYHIIVSESRDRLVLKNIGSLKILDLLYENVQEIIKIARIESVKPGERYEIEMIVCTRKNIYTIDVS